MLGVLLIPSKAEPNFIDAAAAYIGVRSNATQPLVVFLNKLYHHALAQCVCRHVDFLEVVRIEQHIEQHRSGSHLTDALQGYGRKRFPLFRRRIHNKAQRVAEGLNRYIHLENRGIGLVVAV